jgi:V8-like Glu-specific endopeptidase
MQKGHRALASLSGLLLVIPALGCDPQTGTGGDAVVQTSAPLLDTTVQSTVALMTAPGEVFCSGSLVSPLVVLTAAHCVLTGGTLDVPFAVYSGSNAAIGGQYARVLKALAHPDYEPFDGNADVALLRLASAVEGSSPIPLAEEPASPGAEMRFVGFGSSDAGPLAYRHVGTAEVTSAEDDRFSYEPGTCPGDSGAPVLEETMDGDRLVGVVSSGDFLCSRGTAASVPVYAAWIAEGIRDLDPEDCRGGDDQCGTTCPLGDADCPCEEDDRCLLCDGADPDCSSACGPDGDCATRCVTPDPDCYAGDNEAECTEDDDCMSALCLDGRCRQRCGVDPRLGCPPWLECAEVGEDVSACLSPPAEPGTDCSLARGDAGGGSATPWLLGWVAAVWLGRRRRRKRERMHGVHNVKGRSE